MRHRHIPIRSCVACRTSGDKRGLLRVLRTPEGMVVFDPTGKANGRGAYVCATAACIAVARKRKSFSRSLKAEPPPDLYEELLSRASSAEPRD